MYINSNKGIPTISVGDVNISLSGIDMSSTQEISKYTVALNRIIVASSRTINQTELIDIYRILYPQH